MSIENIAKNWSSVTDWKDCSTPTSNEEIMAVIMENIEQVGKDKAKITQQKAKL